MRQLDNTLITARRALVMSAAPDAMASALREQPWKPHCLHWVCGKMAFI